MPTRIFSVLDNAAGRFLDPFVAPTVEVALRGFRHVVNKPGHQFNDFPEDYALFLVGEFDAQLGTMAAHDAVKIATASSVLGSEISNGIMNGVPGDVSDE